MSKAHFICKDCKCEVDVSFNAGESPSAPNCEKCGKPMIRKFNKINVGAIIPDDIMYVSRMMSNQSSKN